MDDIKKAYLRGKLEGGLTIIDLLDNLVNQHDLTGKEELIKTLVRHVKKMHIEMLEALTTNNDEDISKLEEKLKTYEHLLDNEKREH